MRVLFLHEYGINPTAGGISRMTSVLADGLICEGLEVFYISMNKIEGYNYGNKQFFFPNSKEPQSIENYKYFAQFIINKKINILINQATGNSLYTDISFSIKHMNVKIFSVLHNSLLTPLVNFHALHENRIRSAGFSFAMPVFKSKLFISVLKTLYRFKHQNHYKKLQKNSDEVILVSNNNIAEFLYMINSFKSINVSAISNAISIDKYNYNPKDKINEVLWVGTPDFSIKRLDLALQIWSLVENKNSNWNLTVLGDSPSLQNAKDLAHKLNLSSVKFLGRQNPENYYKRASMLMMTSTTESFGLVLIEAMHFGAIPIAFDSFPAAKDIIGCDNGLLIDAFNIKNYSNKILELINNYEMRQSLIISNINKSKKYDIHFIVKKWIKLFNK